MESNSSRDAFCATDLPDCSGEMNAHAGSGQCFHGTLLFRLLPEIYAGAVKAPLPIVLCSREYGLRPLQALSSVHIRLSVIISKNAIGKSHQLLKNAIY